MTTTTHSSNDGHTILLPHGFFDRHLHLRRGKMTELVLPYSTQQAWGAIVMPNTAPHIFTPTDATQYEKDIFKLRSGFKTCMTCYLTDNTKPEWLESGFKQDWYAAKLYPANATSNSAEGVTSLEKAFRCFETMEQIGMPLLIHGEHIDDKEEPEDFEHYFLDKDLPQITSRFPKLKIVLEHVTTKDAAELVLSEVHNIWATVTAHHMLLEHKDLFQSGSIIMGTFRRGIRPMVWNMPILKRRPHREAVLRAVCSGSKRFGAGTDSAPWDKPNKYKDHGCGGCTTSPYAIELYTTAVEQGGGLEHLSDFLGVNMLKDVYDIKPRTGNDLSYQLAVTRQDHVAEPTISTGDGGSQIIVENLFGGETLRWKVTRTSN